MIIQGYTYVTHKLINRPWGPECRFTVRRPDGTLIDDTVPIGSMKIEESPLVDAILGHLKIIDVPPPVKGETSEEKVMRLETQIQTLSAEKETLVAEKAVLLTKIPKGVK